jgi:hypothetical protein
MQFFLERGAGIKFKNKKNFRYDIPAYTAPYQALVSSDEFLRDETKSETSPSNMNCIRLHAD